MTRKTKRPDHNHLKREGLRRRIEKTSIGEMETVVKFIKFQRVQQCTKNQIHDSGINFNESEPPNRCPQDTEMFRGEGPNSIRTCGSASPSSHDPGSKRSREPKRLQFEVSLLVCRRQSSRSLSGFLRLINRCIDPSPLMASTR